MTEKVGEIKRIAYWLSEIKKIDDLLKKIRFSNEDENKIIKTKYIFEHRLKTWTENRIEIDNNTMGRFCEFMKNEKAHLEENISEYDEEIVDIARAYLKGELGQLVEMGKH